MSELQFSPGPLRGEIRVPGDKSISHRALIAGAALDEPLPISNLNAGRDVKATLEALRALGIRIDQNADRALVKPSALKESPATIDCMNSGSTVRLMMGVCSGANLRARFDGDESLRKRPMEPVAAQLRAFGAHIETNNGLLPIALHGTAQAKTQRFILITPSAQVKSALLFCALFAKASISILGDRGSRDHTERMLQSFGANLRSDGKRIDYEYGPLRMQPVDVPGDFSSAAFFMVAASITPGSAITLKDIGVNPTRTGLLDALLQMGARIELRNHRTWAGEPVADIQVQSAPLRAITVGPDLALRAIDEVLVLSVAAARAAGTTKITGIRELRTKESDRVAAIGRILASVDVKVESLPNGIEIVGGTGNARGGTILTHGDHRTAMSVAALAASAGPLVIDDAAGIDVSFPGFRAALVKAQA